MYLGNTLQAAYSSYLLIDSLSASFNGTTTSFALKVNGVAPVPFPLNEQNVLISVGGVPQKPDPTGAEGFKFSGTNIVFSSAPKTGEAFWGVVLAGADYVNVGVSYPDGTAATPSITFNTTKTTGLYLAGISTLGFATAGILRSTIDSNGNLSVVSTGSATAPAVAVGTGTTYAPGIYSPGTDQLAISTSGAGRLYVDASGNLGVATSNPTAILQASLSSSSTGLAISTSLPTIVLDDSVGTTGSSFWGQINTTTYFFNKSNGDLILGTNNNEKMRLDSSGNVGIGVTPSVWSGLVGLDISSYGGVFGFTNQVGIIGNAYYNTTYKYKSTAAASYYNQIAGAHVWYNAPSGTAGNTISFTPAMTLDSSGRLGLGTTSPQTLLHLNGVFGSSTTANILSLRNGSAASASNIAQIDFWLANTYGGNEAAAAIQGLNPNAAGNNGGALAFAVSSYSTASTPTERMRLTPTGLGIGTTSPGYLLTVAKNNNDSQPTAQVINSNAGGSAATYFSLVSNSTQGAGITLTSTAWGNYGLFKTQSAVLDASGTSSTYLGLAGQAGILFGVGANPYSEVARFDSSGRLGIGTIGPSEKLHVSGGNVLLQQGNYFIIPDSGGTYGASNGSYIGNSGQNLQIQMRNSGDGVISFGIGATEAARIDTSRRLLVGTSTACSNFYLAADNTTPFYQVQTTTNTYSNGISILNYSLSGYPPTLNFGISQTNTTGTNALVGTTDLGIINFTGNDGTNFRTGATIRATTDGTPASGSMPSRLVFSTTPSGSASPTTKMQINNDGKSGVYSTNPDVFIASSSSAAGSANYLFRGAYSATAPLNGTVSFQVTTNGNVTNTNGSYTSISDQKLKENIVDASSQWKDVKAFRIRNWNFKEETGYETHRQISPIAQELEQVSPNLVFEILDRDENGKETGEVTKGINLSVLYMKAVKALQEAMERIETLEAKITALEGK